MKISFPTIVFTLWLVIAVSTVHTVTATSEAVSPEDEYYEEQQYYDEEPQQNGEGSWQLNEADRRIEYAKRGYRWPIPDEHIRPQTDGWVERTKRRLQQMAQMEADSGARYEGFVQAVTTGLLVQNFTQHGFGITQVADEDLMQELRKAIYDGLPTADVEGEDAIIPGPNQPLLIRNRDDLLHRVLKELQPYAETWAGMELLPYGAYGFRVYRNESQLYMHIDRPQTHVISFILHIASSDDAVPWPLFIEDLQGQTHEVTLTSGDLLFYESSKLMHGRPRPLNGSWYSSVFVHYYPKQGWADRQMELEAHYAVPEIWSEQSVTIDPTVPKLQMVETSLTEPECVHQWCDIPHAIKWGGPGEVGYLLNPNQEKIPFNPPPYRALDAVVDEL